MKIDGQCHCGAIRFEADANPDNVVICHCSDCQTFSGAPFRVSVFIEAGSFNLLAGVPTVYIKTAESGANRRQAFCPACGTAIYSSEDADAPRQQSLRVGSLRQRDQLVPKKQIWCRSQRDWLPGLSGIAATELQQ